MMTDDSHTVSLSLFISTHNGSCSFSKKYVLEIFYVKIQSHEKLCF